MATPTAAVLQRVRGRGTGGGGGGGRRCARTSSTIPCTIGPHCARASLAPASVINSAETTVALISLLLPCRPRWFERSEGDRQLSFAERLKVLNRRVRRSLLFGGDVV